MAEKLGDSGFVKALIKLGLAKKTQPISIEEAIHELASKPTEGPTYPVFDDAAIAKVMEQYKLQEEKAQGDAIKLAALEQKVRALEVQAIKSTMEAHLAGKSAQADMEKAFFESKLKDFQKQVTAQQAAQLYYGTKPDLMGLPYLIEDYAEQAGKPDIQPYGQMTEGQLAAALDKVLLPGSTDNVYGVPHAKVFAKAEIFAAIEKKFPLPKQSNNAEAAAFKKAYEYYSKAQPYKPPHLKGGVWHDPKPAVEVVVSPDTMGAMPDIGNAMVAVTFLHQSQAHKANGFKYGNWFFRREALAEDVAVSLDFEDSESLESERFELALASEELLKKAIKRAWERQPLGFTSLWRHVIRISGPTFDAFREGALMGKFPGTVASWVKVECGGGMFAPLELCLITKSTKPMFKQTKPWPIVDEKGLEY